VWLLIEAELIQVLMNYGLAGVVIYLLFKLIYNDMKEIKSELKEIRLLLEKLLERLAKQ
jgi:hypothetical protein